MPFWSQTLCAISLLNSLCPSRMGNTFFISIIFYFYSILFLFFIFEQLHQWVFVLIYSAATRPDPSALDLCIFYESLPQFIPKLSEFPVALLSNSLHILDTIPLWLFWLGNINSFTKTISENWESPDSFLKRLTEYWGQEGNGKFKRKILEEGTVFPPWNTV